MNISRAKGVDQRISKVVEQSGGGKQPQATCVVANGISWGILMPVLGAAPFWMYVVVKVVINVDVSTA